MKQVIVKLARSRIGTTPYQRRVLDSLGLRKLQKAKIFADTPALRGAVAKIPHLLEVTEASAQ